MKWREDGGCKNGMQWKALDGKNWSLFARGGGGGGGGWWWRGMISVELNVQMGNRRKDGRYWVIMILA